MKTNRIPILALALTFSLAACKGNKSGNSSDSTKVDSSSVTKVDSTVKPDTSKKDSAKMGADTSRKVDTVTKSSVKTTEVKKSARKKE